MNDYAAQQRLIAALRHVERYPHGARAVKLIETHISWVLLAGRYAYKIKKALDLGFLDFTTLEARRFYCFEEIRLNRRLAPKIYLDVVPIVGSHDNPQMGGTDQNPGAQPAIEYAVRMRRFAAGKLMDHLLARGKVTAHHMDVLAATLARFHDNLPAAEAGSTFGSGDTIRTATLQNFAHLQPMLTDATDRNKLADLRQATENEFAKCGMHFEERRTQGFVRECHGDLHLGNLVLIGDEPVPFDGIEFNPELRWIDVINEVAFTMMDLLHRDHPQLAFRFLNAYLEHTGDYAGVAVLRFCLAYRAMVRAKVDAIRASQADLPKRAKTSVLADCHSYLALAAHCLMQRRPALIITHGLPGSGKSTFAQMALERYGAIRIRSDVERKRLFGLDALEDSRSRVGTGIYSAEATQRTYSRLLELARALLIAGYPVIVDAAFLKREERLQFRSLAQKMAVPFAIASIQAQPSTLRARITQRHERAHDASEANHDVLKNLQNAQEPLTTEERGCTAEFSNEHADELGHAQAWNQLEKILG